MLRAYISTDARQTIDARCGPALAEAGLLAPFLRTPGGVAALARRLHAGPCSWCGTRVPPVAGVAVRRGPHRRRPPPDRTRPRPTPARRRRNAARTGRSPTPLDATLAVRLHRSPARRSPREGPARPPSRSTGCTTPPGASGLGRLPAAPAPGDSRTGSGEPATWQSRPAPTTSAAPRCSAAADSRASRRAQQRVRRPSRCCRYGQRLRTTSGRLWRQPAASERSFSSEPAPVRPAHDLGRRTA